MNAILNAAYNNYLTAYTPKSITRYDTHKKSELRSVYNSIVKMNKDAPWYLPTTDKNTQHYAVDIKENARALRNTIAEIGGLEDGLLNKKTAYSSDESIIQATYIGNDQSEEHLPAIEIEVHSLATSQENLGKFLPNSKIELPPDTYSFDVNINDLNYEFQFVIGENESNKEVQERLVRLINNANIGIRAEISEAEGMTALRMTSENTGLNLGKDVQFTISDDQTSKRTGTIEYFGLDYVSRQARNAEFSVNGESHQATTNRFTIGKLFEIQLNSISEPGNPLSIGLKTDMDSLADNVSRLLGSYNEFLKAASSYNDSHIKGKQLTGELKGLANYYKNSLEDIGISIDEDGTLNLDREQMQRTTLSSDNLEERFQSLKTFSDSLLRKSNQVALNPMNYVEKTVVAYKNPGHNFVSPYHSSAYSGMMFNYYC